MRSVYRGAAMSMILAIVTVGLLLWQLRRSDLRVLATKADIATINTERRAEIRYQEGTRDQRYNSLIRKIDSVRTDLKQEVRKLKK